MKRLLLFLVVLGMVFTFSPAAYSGLMEGTLEITTQVPQVCFVSTRPVRFPNYTGGEVEAHGKVDVACSIGVEYRISMGTGYFVTQTGSYRTMTLGGDPNEVENYIEYVLYSPHDQHWGNGSAFGDIYPDPDDYPDDPAIGAGLTTWTHHDVRGVTVADTTPPVTGSYSDYVTVTIILEQ